MTGGLNSCHDAVKLNVATSLTTVTSATAVIAYPAGIAAAAAAILVSIFVNSAFPLPSPTAVFGSGVRVLVASIGCSFFVLNIICLILTIGNFLLTIITSVISSSPFVVTVILVLFARPFAIILTLRSFYVFFTITALTVAIIIR